MEGGLEIVGVGPKELFWKVRLAEELRRLELMSEAQTVICTVP